MTTQVSTAILSTSLWGSLYNTCGTGVMSSGVGSIEQHSVAADSVIFVTPITNSTATGQLTISSITPNSGFSVLSSVTTGNSNSFCYFMLQPTSGGFAGNYQISLCYAIDGDNEHKNLGRVDLVNGTASVSLPGMTGNSTVILGRVHRTGNVSWGNLCATISGGVLTITSTSSIEIETINYLVVEDATNRMLFSPPINSKLIILDKTPGSETFGSTNLVEGTITITTTACLSTSYIFFYQASRSSGLNEYVLINNQVNGSFTLTSGSSTTSTSKINWLIVNV